MAIDWSSLRDPAPGTLVQARETAHCALQWVAKAARANLRAGRIRGCSPCSAVRRDWQSRRRASNPLLLVLVSSSLAGFAVSTLSCVPSDTVTSPPRVAACCE